MWSSGRWAILVHQPHGISFCLEYLRLVSKPWSSIFPWPRSGSDLMFRKALCGSWNDFRKRFLCSSEVFPSEGEPGRTGRPDENYSRCERKCVCLCVSVYECVSIESSRGNAWARTQIICNVGPQNVGSQMLGKNTSHLFQRTLESQPKMNTLCGTILLKDGTKNLASTQSLPSPRLDTLPQSTMQPPMKSQGHRRFRPWAVGTGMSPSPGLPEDDKNRFATWRSQT